MKNQVTLLAVVTALLFSVTLSFAQTHGGTYYNPRSLYPSHRPAPGTVFGRDGYAVSNHSLSAQVLGLEYSFEGALTGNFTLIGRAGLVPTGIAYQSSLMGSTNAHFAVGLGLTLEPRVYTSFDRRARMGRTTYMNSSDFVALRSQLIWAQEGFAWAFTPLYGIRRTTGDHWAHEFTIGPRIALVGEDYNFTPHIQYRLVFMF